MSARDELEAKLKRLIQERERLKNKRSLKYGELTGKIDSLTEYLETHNDEYIEKDAKFNRDLCPISAKWSRRKKDFNLSLAEKGKMNDVCRFKDCPDYETCWATKSTKTPSEIIFRDKNGKTHDFGWQEL